MKGTFSFESAEAAENFKQRWENGEISDKVTKKLQQRGYEGDLQVRYFNSNMPEEKEGKVQRSRTC